jgi:hypothetical protein
MKIENTFRYQSILSRQAKMVPNFKITYDLQTLIHAMAITSLSGPGFPNNYCISYSYVAVEIFFIHRSIQQFSLPNQLINEILVFHGKKVFVSTLKIF